MKKFVPKNHSQSHLLVPLFIISALILSCLCVIIAILENDRPLLSCLKPFPQIFLPSSALTLLLPPLEKHSIPRGLIIDGETLIHKGLWKKKISPQDIVAIKITKAVIHFTRGGDVDLIDKDGNQLYTMFLLKGYMPWAMNEKEGKELTSDTTFQTCYGEYAFCSVVYDQEVIDHLLRLNPNIVIC